MYVLVRQCVSACVCVCVCVFNVPLTSKVICRQVHSLDMLLKCKFVRSKKTPRTEHVECASFISQTSEVRDL